MHISQVAERHPIAAAMIDAASQDGQPISDDYNGEDQEGFGYYQVAQKDGRRWSVYEGYLKPALGRPNLTVRTHAHVTKINVDQGQCRGVTFQHQGKTVTVQANIDVVMAAGSVQTPQILELSGVGNPTVLQANGIRVVHPAPQVGENYIDHFATRMNWRVRNTHTLNETAQGWRVMLAALKYFITHKGILTLGTGLVHGFVKTRPDMATPDAQYFIMPASYANAAVRKLDSAPGMTIGVTGLRPTSRGSIHIESRDPMHAPAIIPNFLETPEDQNTLIDAMKLARRIVARPAMAHYIDHEMNPGKSVQSNDEWLQFARENGQTIYHPIGTCKMGTDNDAVVDVRLRFKGINGLRIVDASVMPAMVSGNTQAAVMMVAERGADLILEDARA
jgi:choline dehydrogenase-like flavoprotein